MSNPEINEFEFNGQTWYGNVVTPEQLEKLTDEQLRLVRFLHDRRRAGYMTAKTSEIEQKLLLTYEAPGAQHRSVRLQVREVNKHVPICSCSRGFFYPCYTEEVEAYLKALAKKARSVFQRVRWIAKSVDQSPEQYVLEGLAEDE